MGLSSALVFLVLVLMRSEAIPTGAIRGTTHSTANGTTPNIEEIVIGRCHQYQQLVNPAAFVDGLRDCQRIWNLFYEAFSKTNGCGVNVSNYDAFIDATSHRIDHDKVVLWKGQRMYDTVKQLSHGGNRYTALSDTMMGYLVDSLTWCGNGSGINYTWCPNYGSCPGDPIKSFWSASSAEFARRSEGTVTLLLNGSAPTAYYNESIMQRVELPNLNPSKVTQVVISLIYGINLPRRETCQADSIRQLKTELDSYGLTKHVCVEQPRDVHLMLCVDHPHVSQCQLASSSSSCLLTTVLDHPVLVIGYILVHIYMGTQKKIVLDMDSMR